MPTRPLTPSSGEETQARNKPSEPADVTTVGSLVKEYLAARTDVKKGTAVNLDQTGKALVAFFGETRSVADVTEADAENFYRHLLAKHAFNTARGRTGRAKQFFAHAVRKRLPATNPFNGVKTATCGNPALSNNVQLFR